MAQRIDMDVGDFERLVAALRYAIIKAEEVEPAMAEFLRDELEEVMDHVENEQRGDEIAREIDVVLDFIGGTE